MPHYETSMTWKSAMHLAGEMRKQPRPKLDHALASLPHVEFCLWAYRKFQIKFQSIGLHLKIFAFLFRREVLHMSLKFLVKADLFSAQTVEKNEHLLLLYLDLPPNGWNATMSFHSIEKSFNLFYSTEYLLFDSQDCWRGSVLMVSYVFMLPEKKTYCDNKILLSIIALENHLKISRNHPASYYGCNYKEDELFTIPLKSINQNIKNLPNYMLMNSTEI